MFCHEPSGRSNPKLLIALLASRQRRLCQGLYFSPHRPARVALGVGYAAEFVGEAVDALSMEERMTICNMSIEFGSKIGIMNPDQTTFDYLKDKACVPKDFEAAVADWKTLVSDKDATYDKVITLDVSDKHLW